MSAYRFCRTDDIGLLVDALNRCWLPYFPEEAPMTAPAFKRSIRDLQVWCSSCMVAFSGSDVVGVLIGAKRPTGTLVHTIAVHPDQRRQGHARHLLASLSSKLAILGPPRIVAEVPETLKPASALFRASGYVEEATLTDYVLQASQAGTGAPRWLTIPVTIDDLAANGLLVNADRHTCWSRAVETLTAKRSDIEGLAVASEEQLEAYILYSKSGADEIQILSLHSLVDDDGARVEQLLARVRGRSAGTLLFPKVHPAEVSERWLQKLGFAPVGRYGLYSATPG